MSADKILDFADAVSRYDVVIGLEVHVELGTETKMFDCAPNIFGAEPNTCTTPVSLGIPGTLPVVNEKAVESAVRLGISLGCNIAESCRFARKNYFYPDLTKNFQTSQSDEPIAYDGQLEVEMDNGDLFTVPIERAHMEEDAGKNTHIGGTDGRIQGADYSLVDYNRAGVPIIEIVTRPIIGAGARAPEIAAAYVRTIRDIARALNISEARMERGNVRADVNVSLRPQGQVALGTRTETKNVNSFRAIEAAVRYEICRQAAVIDAGEPVVQETRHWHESDQTTSAGRPKSDADDYRYFPEPDLVPVAPSAAWVAELKATLPKLPHVRRRELREAWNFTQIEMQDVVNAGALELIEATVLAGASPAGARKWWMGDIARYAKDHGLSLEEVPVGVEAVVELEDLIASGAINDKLARQALAGVLAGEGSPQEVVTARGLAVVSDDAALLSAIDEALAAQPDIADKIRGGKVQAAGAVVGAVMRVTGGKADAARVRELIMQRCGVQ